MSWRSSYVFVPGGILVILGSVFIHSGLWRSWPEHSLQYLAYAVWLTGLVLGLLFHRTRLLHAILILGTAEALLSGTIPSACDLAPCSPLLRNAIGVLVPLNFMWLVWVRECGLFSVKGAVRLLLILLQPALLFLLCCLDKERVSSFLVEGPHAFLARGAGALSGTALMAIVLSAVSILSSFILRRDTLDAGFFWSLVLIVAALVPPDPGAAASLSFALAGLVLVLSGLQISYRMAYRDELTGLPARRAMNEYADNLSGRYTVAMVDIDRFKKVNDRYGHDVGDQVLRMVAAQLARVRGGGKTFRYGGEEFAIIFHGRQLADILPHVEALRASVESKPFVLRGKDRPRQKPETAKAPRKPGRKLPITISVGVAEMSDKHDTFASVIKAADKALYRAKRSGRNRISPRRAKA